MSPETIGILIFIVMTIFFGTLFSWFMWDMWDEEK